MLKVKLGFKIKWNLYTKSRGQCGNYLNTYWSEKGSLGTESEQKKQNQFGNDPDLMPPNILLYLFSNQCFK